MHSVVLELGSFASWEDVEACSLDAVIAGWLGALLGDTGGGSSRGGRGGLSGVCGGGQGNPGGAASAAGSGRPRRAHAEQPPEAIWAALKTVLQRMRVSKAELRENVGG